MGNAARDDIHRVGRFTLDLSRGALLAPDGAEVPLRPKPFALLCHLVRNAGRLQSHDELLQAVWPGVFVTEDSVTLCVRQLRAALDDQAGRLLRTVPRRGYVLAAEVAPAEAPPPADPGLPEGAPVLRLQPLEVLGEAAADGRFANGLAADLANALARTRWFAVIAADDGGVAGAPGNGPRYVLRGLLRRAAGGEVRVTAALLREGVERDLWTGSFDGLPVPDDAFAQEDRLVAAIAVALLPALRRAEVERVQALPADRVPTEHEADCRASALLLIPSAAHCEAAWTLLQGALARRPGSPLLLSAAALSRYWRISQGHATPAEAGAPLERDRAIALAEAAATAGPDHPVVLMRVALVFSYFQPAPFRRGLGDALFRRGRGRHHPFRRGGAPRPAQPHGGRGPGRHVLRTVDAGPGGRRGGERPARRGAEPRAAERAPDPSAQS